MTAEERYLFDLKGYLVLRQALSPDRVSALNAAIDHLESLSEAQVAELGLQKTYPNPGLYAQVGSDPADGPDDYGIANILQYGPPFEELIDLPAALPYVDAMIGAPCRLDAASLMSRRRGGGFRFHHGAAELLPYSEYAFENDEFRCVSSKISFALTEVDEEGGCFAVIPGSHKSCFLNPLVGQIPDPSHPLVDAVPCRAGDAILFSEDLSHGAVEQRRGRVRRTLFYSYAPAFQCAWNPLGKAEGFDERAPARRRELLHGPAPYARR